MVYLVFMKKTMVFGLKKKNMVFANPGEKHLAIKKIIKYRLKNTNTMNRNRYLPILRPISSYNSGSSISSQKKVT